MNAPAMLLGRAAARKMIHVGYGEIIGFILILYYSYKLFALLIRFSSENLSKLFDTKVWSWPILNLLGHLFPENHSSVTFTYEDICPEIVTKLIFFESNWGHAMDWLWTSFMLETEIIKTVQLLCDTWLQPIPFQF